MAMDKDYGAVYPREFDKCPVCGCKARFCFEAMRGDFSTKQLKEKNPALVGFEYIYETATDTVKLRCIVDSCVGCGAMITLARDKILTPLPKEPPSPPPHIIRLPGGRLPPGPLFRGRG